MVSDACFADNGSMTAKTSSGAAPKKGGQDRHYRVVLADDHRELRLWLKRELEDGTDLKVVGEADDGLELLELLGPGGLQPDMAIVDISMPRLGGIETARKIKRRYPDVKVLIMTVHNDGEYLDEAIAAGAEGYLLKGDAGLELFMAIEMIRRGGIYLSPRIENG